MVLRGGGVDGREWLFCAGAIVGTSAVVDFARSARRRGRTGADDRFPVEVVETAREVDIEVAGLAGAAGFVGEVDVSAADPGRSGRWTPAARALF